MLWTFENCSQFFRITLQRSIKLTDLHAEMSASAWLDKILIHELSIYSKRYVKFTIHLCYLPTCKDWLKLVLPVSLLNAFISAILSSAFLNNLQEYKCAQKPYAWIIGVTITKWLLQPWIYFNFQKLLVLTLLHFQHLALLCYTSLSISFCSKATLKQKKISRQQQRQVS